MGAYRISSRAALDMADIYEYGILNFGLPQARKYLKEMKTLFEMLSERPELRREAFDIRASLFRYNFKSHTVFFTAIDEDIFIVRILGQVMDFQRHI